MGHVTDVMKSAEARKQIFCLQDFHEKNREVTERVREFTDYLRICFPIDVQYEKQPEVSWIQDITWKMYIPTFESMNFLMSLGVRKCCIYEIINFTKDILAKLQRKCSELLHILEKLQIKYLSAEFGKKIHLCLKRVK